MNSQNKSCSVSFLSARDASILGLIARAKSKIAARKLLVGLKGDVLDAAKLLLGDICENNVSERSRILAQTANRWVKDYKINRGK